MSKGLEAFNRIKSYFNPKQLLTKEKTLSDLNTIEKELREYEGAKNHIEALHKERVENSLKLKALEIIKEKEVNVYDFKEYESKYEYNKHTEEEFQELTQEEYDLLKEVLK